MHTIQESFTPEGATEPIIGWAVVFIETNRVGDVVGSSPRLVRQFDTSEWAFIQATELCQKLNGGFSFDHPVLDKLDECLQELHPMLSNLNGLLEIALPKMRAELADG